jgi:hypothetical protein
VIVNKRKNAKALMLARDALPRKQEIEIREFAKGLSVKMGAAGRPD